MTTSKQKKNISPDDLIHSQEVVKKYGISDGEQLRLLHTGKLTGFKYRGGMVETVFPSMEPERWARLTGQPVPDPRNFPKEGLEPTTEPAYQYEPLQKIDLARLTRQDLAETYFLRSEIESIADSLSKTNLSPQALAKQRLCDHVSWARRHGQLTYYDELNHDPVVNEIKLKQNWDDATVIRYVQKCGLLGRKRGRKSQKIKPS